MFIAPAGGFSPPIMKNFTNQNAAMGSTSLTFTSTSIPDAGVGGRLILVCVVAGDGDTTTAPDDEVTAMTVGGVSMTKLISSNYGGTTLSVPLVSIWGVENSALSSGSIVITTDKSCTGAYISAFTMTGMPGGAVATPGDYLDYSSGTTGAQYATNNLAVPNGAFLGCAILFNDSAGTAMTGVGSVATSGSLTGNSRLFMSAYTPNGVSLTDSSNFFFGFDSASGSLTYASLSWKAPQ